MGKRGGSTSAKGGLKWKEGQSTHVKGFSLYEANLIGQLNAKIKRERAIIKAQMPVKGSLGYSLDIEEFVF